MAEVHKSECVREDVMSHTVDSELERDPKRRRWPCLRVNKIAELPGAMLQER